MTGNLQKRRGGFGKMSQQRWKNRCFVLLKTGNLCYFQVRDELRRPSDVWDIENHPQAFRLRSCHLLLYYCRGIVLPSGCRSGCSGHPRFCVSVIDPFASSSSPSAIDDLTNRARSHRRVRSPASTSATHRGGFSRSMKMSS